MSEERLFRARAPDEFDGGQIRSVAAAIRSTQSRHATAAIFLISDVDVVVGCSQPRGPSAGVGTRSWNNLLPSSHLADVKRRLRTVRLRAAANRCDEALEEAAPAAASHQHGQR